MRQKLSQRELLGVGLSLAGEAGTGGSLNSTAATTPAASIDRRRANNITFHNDHIDMAESQTPRFRQSLALNRPELGSADLDDHDDLDDAGSELMNESVVSSVTDRYGFLASGKLDDDIDGGGGGHHDADATVELIRRREAKWLDMLSHWDAYMMKSYKKVRERCRKGIPSSVRPKAWMHLCGAQYHMLNPENKTVFRRLYRQTGNARYIEDIEKDLHRNFPTHEMFGGAYERIGQAELFRVLKAYSVLNPVDGYCQAMAPIAALLLMNMPSEHAFWCLVAICDKYIPGYYSPGMEAIQLDGDILFGLLKKVAPAVHKHLSKQGVEPILYMTEWFLCVFARTLPWPSVMRVWDMFMCEGVKVLFRVALVLLRGALPRTVRKRCPSMYETLDVLKNLPEKVTKEEYLMEQVVKLNISEEDMEREHRKQVKRREQQAKEKAERQQQRQQQQQRQDQEQQQQEQQQQNRSPSS